MKIWRICRANFAGEAFSGDGRAALWRAMEFAGRAHGLLFVFAGAGGHGAVRASGTESAARRSGLDCGHAAQGRAGRRLEPEQLPRGWWTDDFEPLRAIGDKWIREKSSLAIEVPSAALRMEWNVLVNPLHPAMAQIKIEKPQPFQFDARMFR